MKTSSFVLITVLIAALFAALLMGCDNGTGDNNTGGSNTNNPGGSNTDNNSTGGATMTWSGSWTRVSENKYTSNAIGHSANTFERLNIAASSAGTVTIQITASCYDGNYGYASKLDTGVSTSNYQMRVTTSNVATYTYTIPAGSHWIQFMYQKDSSSSSGSDGVTVEVISINY
jgi:hypothetical protein